MKNLSFILLMLAGIASAQTSNEMQYAAYLKASKTMWEKSAQLARESYGADSFEYAMALYGLLNNTMANKDEATFDEYITLTNELLDRLIQSNQKWGEPKAVLASTYGLVMAYSPMKGMFYGGKSSSLISDAMDEQKDSPLVQKLYAGSKLYTPKMFGGDPMRAITAYKKALHLYDEEGQTINNWLYLDTHMGLSMAYEEVGREEDAIRILKKAIRIEPDFYWAKSRLATFDSGNPKKD